MVIVYLIEYEPSFSSSHLELASSFSNLRSIFPLADLGISDRNSIPPTSFLYGATLSETINKVAMLTKAVDTALKTCKCLFV